MDGNEFRRIEKKLEYCFEWGAMDAIRIQMNHMSTLRHVDNSKLQIWHCLSFESESVFGLMMHNHTIYGNFFFRIEMISMNFSSI